MVRRALVAIGITAALGYGAAVGYLMTQETRLVFAAGRPLAETRPSGAFEQVDITRADGQRQFGWVLKNAEQGDSAPWLLFLHGNRATIASRVNIVRYEHLRALGLNVFSPEYRGFGGLDGVPTEASVSADARHGYEYLRKQLGVPPERIVIYGWSLGSAVAVNVASDVKCAAMILEGAPASLVAIGERNYPWMPIRLVMRNPFESILKVRKISSPMLFLHSPNDEIIPIEEGRRLFNAAREPKQFVEIAGGHIRPADDDAPHMFGAIRTFLATHGLLTP
jgi:uncharacterized protein